MGIEGGGKQGLSTSLSYPHGWCKESSGLEKLQRIICVHEELNLHEFFICETGACFVWKIY